MVETELGIYLSVEFVLAQGKTIMLHGGWWFNIVMIKEVHMFHDDRKRSLGLDKI